MRAQSMASLGEGGREIAQLTAPKTQMTNMLTKKEMARAMVDSMELYLIPSFTSTGSLLEMARLCEVETVLGSSDCFVYSLTRTKPEWR